MIAFNSEIIPISWDTELSYIYDGCQFSLRKNCIRLPINNAGGTMKEMKAADECMVGA